MFLFFQLAATATPMVRSTMLVATATTGAVQKLVCGWYIQDGQRSIQTALEHTCFHQVRRVSAGSPSAVGADEPKEEEGLSSHTASAESRF